MDQCPVWCNELVILASPTDGANALKKQTSLEDQVLYAWNRPTTDADLEQFLSHRAKGRFKDYPLIIIGGAHGYASALSVSVATTVATGTGAFYPAVTIAGQAAAAGGVSVGAMVVANILPALHRYEWGASFEPGEFQEANILQEMSEILNIHYVDVSQASYFVDFTALWASYPKADLMICVCYGCATGLAKRMRDKGLTHSLGKDGPNHYVSMKVQWDVKSMDPTREKINLLAKAVGA